MIDTIPSLSLDDPRDEALAQTWSLLDGTAQGASDFIAVRADLRRIRNLNSTELSA